MALDKLVASMAELYSFVDTGDGFRSKIPHFEEVIIRMLVQTIECGIFIRQYTSNMCGSLELSFGVYTFIV